jgi:cyanophycinase-like exopeptidase
MVEMHRAVLAAAGPGAMLILDSPYGFQENADAITRKTIDYFATSVGRVATPVRWRARVEPAELDRILTAIRHARAVYAGPGSPSYALRAWGGSGFTEAVRTLVTGGGTAIFSSAAAIAVGAQAMPTHEIYRCGSDPFWLPGTNLFGALTGINAALVPHYDLQPKNGTHDTRCCYIGERRMRELETRLPPDVHVIGVDEHTALNLDLGAGRARVSGRGAVTVRFGDERHVLSSGDEVPIEQLRPSRVTAPTRVSTRVVAEESVETPLRRLADDMYGRFETAMADQDMGIAANALLAIEQELSESCPGRPWSEDARHARRLLRGMFLELASTANNRQSDPRKTLEPLVSALLARRADARTRRDFAVADLIRDQLAQAGIEIRDTAHGTEWSVDHREQPAAESRELIPEQRTNPRRAHAHGEIS